jgi:hypothetical protein
MIIKNVNGVAYRWELAVGSRKKCVIFESLEYEV